MSAKKQNVMLYFYICGMAKKKFKKMPEKLSALVSLKGKALLLVWNEKQRYRAEKKLISKGEIVNRLLAGLAEQSL